MKIDDVRLMAYADGELDADAAAEVAQAIAADPGLADVVRRHLALRGRLAAAFAHELDEPVPARLLGAIKSPVMQDETRAFGRSRPGRRRIHPRWLAIAAVLVVGIGVASIYRSASPMLQMLPDDTRVAVGALAGELDRRLASDAPGRVSIGLSFRDRDGRWCRTFAMAEKQPVAGLACRDGEGRWRVDTLAAAGASGTGMRQAASSLPPQVLAAVDARIAGEPVDAEQERRARDDGWR